VFKPSDDNLDGIWYVVPTEVNNRGGGSFSATDREFTLSLRIIREQEAPEESVLPVTCSTVINTPSVLLPLPCFPSASNVGACGEILEERLPILKSASLKVPALVIGLLW